MNQPAIALAALFALTLVVACDGSTHHDPTTPISGAQLDRIEASVRERGKQEGIELPESERPLWVSHELLDDRTRLVTHIRLAVAGDLSNHEIHERNCARVRRQVVDALLPGQKFEMYLVFDTTVHSCSPDAQP